MQWNEKLTSSTYSKVTLSSKMTNLPCRARSLLQVRNMGELCGGLEIDTNCGTQAVINEVLIDLRYGFLDNVEVNVINRIC